MGAMDTDVLLVDLGAGTSLNTLDFFLACPNKVVVLTPGDGRPLSDLPAIDVSGTELGRVMGWFDDGRTHGGEAEAG